MKLINVRQGTPEWLYERLGRVTASRVVDVLNIRKDGKPGADRLRYLSELVCERLTHQPVEHYVSPAMDWGTEQESFARAAYEVSTGNAVDQIGIAIHPSLDCFSCSPDGLVGGDGLIEIKAPTTITHINWILAGVVPEEHRAQMYSGMMCCERAWADFISYDPRLPEPLQLFVKRLEWEDEHTDRIATAVAAFDAEVNATIARLVEIAGPFTIPAQMQARQQSTEGLGVSDEEIRDVDPTWNPVTRDMNYLLNK